MKTYLSEILPGTRQLMFWCPGCKETHGVPVSQAVHTRPFWDWNGSRDAPTLNPSIRVTSGKEHGNRVCHFSLEHGRLHYLSDSWHPLAGTTIDLPEWPD